MAKLKKQKGHSILDTILCKIFTFSLTVLPSVRLHFQDRGRCAHRFLNVCGGAFQGEEGRAPQLAVHVLDDWRDLCVSYGVGHHTTLR